MVPQSTYRVQLHAGFRFDDAAALAPYLASLGVTHLYCSPYLQAAAGSTHGYDVVDPGRLNEELGGDAGHRRLLAALADAGLGQVLDVVPNHMALAGRANRWWWDVLENGPSSVRARCFDVDWGAAGRDEPTVLVPILGDAYGRVVDAGQIRVVRQGGSLVVRYHEHELPLSPRTYDELLEPAAARAGSAALAALARAFGALPHAARTDPASIAERHARKEELRERLAELCRADEEAAKALELEFDALHADPDRLDRLLRRQNYRLAFWRTASEELDYRRFFNIETLVGVRVEDPDVFADTHALVLELVRRGAVDGLRIDHVDGLRDPAGYLARLREASGGVYTVVEKILETGETLPADWPVAGTTGYEFAARVDGLFVDSRSEAAMTRCYERFTGEPGPFHEVAYHAKRAILRGALRAEVDRLTAVLAAACEGHRRQRDHTRRDLRDALVELVAAFPVYRTYTQPGRPASDADRAAVRAARRAAAERRPELDAELLDFLEALALLELSGPAEVEFGLRLAQLTAPVMAKGVEDTAFYRYNRLVSLNEVGGDPGVFGRSPDAFHRDTAAAAARWPETMLTLSTHDTKRSADVRARIHLLSEIPDAWEEAVGRLAARAERHRRGDAPDRSAEYLLYQTLVGAWPLDPERAVAYMRKAAREAKLHTTWENPAPAYEEALEGFVRGVLADEAFVAVLEGFLARERIAERGRETSLAQTALLLACPGVADVYQGTELWDLSLVDPDNRRPVAYGLRARLLASLGEAPPEVELALDDAGVSKLWLIARALADRRRRPEAYRGAGYEPLPLDGAKAEHAVAFSRGALAAVAPRLVAGRGEGWGDTSVRLPAGRWTHALTGAPIGRGGPVRLAELLAPFPVAVLAREGA